MLLRFSTLTGLRVVFLELRHPEHVYRTAGLQLGEQNVDVARAKHRVGAARHRAALHFPVPERQDQDIDFTIVQSGLHVIRPKVRKPARCSPGTPGNCNV